MNVTLRRGYHQVYDELLNNPPAGVTYEVAQTVSGSRASSPLKRKAWSAYLTIARQPNSIYVPSSSELIHSGGALVKNESPWVVDLEHVNSLVGFRGVKRLNAAKPKAERLLASPHCRKILPWSDAGKTSLLNGLDCSKFKGKMEVVYPAVSVPEKVMKKESQRVRLLFVGGSFYVKGGRETLKAFDVLAKKYDADLTMVSDVPAEFKDHYPNVKFLEPNLSREKLFVKCFSQADIFVMPSYMETFGLVFLEAMSASLPVVTTNVFAMPEIVKGCGAVVDASKYSFFDRNMLFAYDTLDGFMEETKRVRKPEVVERLVQALSLLIEDSSMRRKLGYTGYEKVANGVFSIKHRNAQLKKIYEEALR